MGLGSQPRANPLDTTRLAPAIPVTGGFMTDRPAGIGQVSSAFAMMD
jgi:hypothetical protein